MPSTPIIPQNPEPCPYLSDRLSRMETFFAKELTPAQLDRYLSQGWRKFGLLYFRPRCHNCRDCIPIRIDVKKFSPSLSQKRVLEKNKLTQVLFRDLEYRSEILKIYQDHSQARFGQTPGKSDLMQNFYQASCPSFQSEYFINGQLSGVGFIDQSSTGLSSVYFAFSSSASPFSLGTFSILAEIDHAAKMGLDYYYLGYYVAENESLKYKSRFYPHQRMEWESESWISVEKTKNTAQTKT